MDRKKTSADLHYNTQHNLIANTLPAAAQASTTPSVLSPDYYLMHYKELLPRYIGHGRPSVDTLNHYFSYIDQFISWCIENNYHPVLIRDFEMRGYLEWLYAHGYKNDTVAVKLVSIRRFFVAAMKFGIIQENPCEDVYVPNAAPDELIRFFTPDQLFEICEFYAQDDNIFRRNRNISIVYLMGVEGMRNVEIHRMNREDIDEEIQSIFVHGKGHDRRIYPCEETMSWLHRYLSVYPKHPKKDGPFTPMFVSDSHKNLWGRISRNGIRFIMNQALEQTGFKKPGISCHVFRHSAGTNLYAATKDLRLVQDTLGHRDPKTTARYAHVQERMAKRRTAAIVPHKKQK